MRPIRTIQNAKNIPLGAKAGNVPNMQGALQSYYQPMTFVFVNKTVNGGYVYEAGTSIDFEGFLNVYKPTELEIKRIGERKWIWKMLYCTPQLMLNADDCVNYLGIQYRVMSVEPFELYNFRKYKLIEDWKDSGPSTIPYIPETT